MSTYITFMDMRFSFSDIYYEMESGDEILHWRVRFIQSLQDPRLFIISGDSSNLGAHPEDWRSGHMVLTNLRKRKKAFGTFD